MPTRGERDFARLPRLAAWLYDWLLRIPPAEEQAKEIALVIASRVPSGRLLDVGTGPGRLLLEIHKCNPGLLLFGLDISAAMIRRAESNLRSINVDLRQGNINNAPYESNYFDAITSVGSLYLWDQPVRCIDEIFRILKGGSSAYLYESYRDYDPDQFSEALSANVRAIDPIRRRLSPVALRKQLRMTYRSGEYAQILDRSKFAATYTVDRATLARLPVWLRITLTKPLQ